MTKWIVRLYMQLIYYYGEGVAMIYDLVEVTDVMMVLFVLLVSAASIFCYLFSYLLPTCTNESIHYSYTTVVVPLRTEYLSI